MVLIVALISIWFNSPYTAEGATSPKEFYTNNRVVLVVPSSPGGGSDFAARIFAGLWSKVVKGGRMIVKNKPGGGQILGVNYVYSSKPNGRIIGMAASASGLMGPAIFGAPGVAFDLKKFSWLGYPVDDGPPLLGVGKNTPYESIKDLQKAKNIKFGALGPRSQQSLNAAVLIDIFGLDAKIVPGYSGSSKLELGVGQGEIIGYPIAAPSLQGSIDKGVMKSRPIIVISSKKSDYFPDVPTIPEIVQLTPDQTKALKITNSLKSSKMFFAPPGMPGDKLEFLRRKFDEIMKLPEYQKKMKIRWKKLHIVNGEELTKFINKAVKVTKKDVAIVEQLVEKHMSQ
jgi:tripartite-type tricarboxylate transporter receptor subunit TctC